MQLFLSAFLSLNNTIYVPFLFLFPSLTHDVSLLNQAGNIFFLLLFQLTEVTELLSCLRFGTREISLISFEASQQLHSVCFIICYILQMRKLRLPCPRSHAVSECLKPRQGWPFSLVPPCNVCFWFLGIDSDSSFFANEELEHSGDGLSIWILATHLGDMDCVFSSQV